MKVIFRNTAISFETKEKTWQLCTEDANGRALSPSDNPVTSENLSSGYKTVNPQFPMKYDTQLMLRVTTSAAVQADTTIRVLDESSVAITGLNMTYPQGSTTADLYFTVPTSHGSHGKKFQIIVDTNDAGLNWTLGVYEKK